MGGVGGGVKGVGGEGGVGVYGDEEGVLGGVGWLIGDWVGEDWGKRVLKEWGKVDDMGMRELWGVIWNGKVMVIGGGGEFGMFGG